MSEYELTADDLAAVARMRAAEQRLIDSGAPPSTLGRGKQRFGIGMNADGTLNLVDPASPRTDGRAQNGVQTWTCPVCGFPGLDEPTHDPHGGPTYAICPCCGFEPGYTDEDQGYSHESWRARWAADGMPWRDGGISDPPPSWDPSAQLYAAGLS